MTGEPLPSWLSWLVAAGVALGGVAAVEHYNSRAGLMFAGVIVLGAIVVTQGRAAAFSKELTAIFGAIQAGPSPGPGPTPGGGNGGGSPPSGTGQYVNPVPGGTFQDSHWDGGLAVDVFAPSGTPVNAPIGGRVVGATYSLGGNTATLYGSDGLVYYFAHLLTPISDGLVRIGEQIGQVGNSGNARNTPSHTHFAISDAVHGISGAGTGTIAPWAWLRRIIGGQ